MNKMVAEGATQSSSKINRDGLALTVPFEAPADELERTMAAIFAEVFMVNQVGANDQFFELGGDSLLAETLSVAISERAGYDFPMSRLVEFNSPRKIAAFLKSEGTPAIRSEGAPPIFLVHGRDGFMLPKPAFYEALAPGQQLRMFELPGIRGGQSSTRVEDIAADYVRQLVQEYPTGPILLGAFCRGGLIGLEMACQLAEQGRPVCHLLLFDPGIPKSTLVNFRRRKGANAEPETWRPLVQGDWFFETRGRLQKPAVHGLWLLLCMTVLGRTTDGCRDEDFADTRLRYLRELSLRAKFWRRRRGGRHKYSEFQLSIPAQAKLRAAYLHYKPRVYDGPASILTSLKRHAAFEDPDAIWARILPRRRLYLASEIHSDITKADLPETARLMVRIFESALAGNE